MPSRPDVVLVMLGLSKIYDYTLSDPLIEIWNRVLRDLSKAELEFAVDEYVRGGSPFFPKPGQIYQLVRPNQKIENAEADAQIIVEKIYSVQASVGTDAEGCAKARERIGEAGWEYIKLVGGWYVFWMRCQTEGVDSTIKSQTRKALLGLMNQQKQTEVRTQIEFKNLAQQIGLKMQSIPEKKD